MRDDSVYDCIAGQKGKENEGGGGGQHKTIEDRRMKVV